MKALRVNTKSRSDKKVRATQPVLSARRCRVSSQTAAASQMPKNGTGTRNACWSKKLYAPYHDRYWLR